MSTHPDGPDTPVLEAIPEVESLVADTVVSLAFAALAYLDERQPADAESAAIAIDVAAAGFERVRERLKPEKRLAIAQLLAETRLKFVSKRGP